MRPKPFLWKLRRARNRIGDQEIEETFSGGIIDVEVAPNERISIELFQRHEGEIGLRIRALDSALDIEPEVSNTIIVKPRPRS